MFAPVRGRPQATRVTRAIDSRRRAIVGGLAGLAVAPFFSGGPARAQDARSRDALTRRLRDGRVELRSLERGRTLAQAMIDATFTRTMRALCDFPRYAEWLAPVVRRSVVLERSHGRARLYIEVSIADGAETRWAELDVRIDGSADGTHTMTATRRRGDLRAFAAEVALVATPGRVRTLVGVTMHVDPDLPVPLDPSPDAARAMVHALRIATR